MKRKIISMLLAAAALSAVNVPAVNAASENWRDPFVTRLMKTISQDPSYTDVVLTDLDRNGIPEAFVVKKGTYGNIGCGFTMVSNVITDIQTPSNIIGECLENIDVYIKNDRYIFVGAEVPRYASNIAYYKLELSDNKLTATRIKKSDVSPYSHITYADKFSNNLLENGYPNRTKISDFIASYDMVNSISANVSGAAVMVDGTRYTLNGYNVNDSNYFRIRDIAMIMRNTGAKFNVDWDSKTDGIRIVPGADYVPIGGELSNSVGESLNVLENNTPTFINDKQTAITSYIINGSAYFKIRDIADAAGFAIGWDDASQIITIDAN
ncbi:MAG: hypothetical protein PUD92_00395 [Clostridiales bacterium]|nr:hypothetical protein [Clostridiales bacterium]